MTAIDPLSFAALALAGALSLGLLMLRQRARLAPRRDERPPDTVADWPPEVARVLSIDERQAFELLRRALPGFMVLAQVPLARFVRVPMRRPYGDWLARAGNLNADLLVCDKGSRVLAVVDIRAAAESDRSRHRHERLARVLRAAGVHVLVWRENDMPSPIELRHQFASLLEGRAADIVTASGSMPLIPVPEIAEILAEGDLIDHTMEPVPSGFYDEAMAEKA